MRLPNALLPLLLLASSPLAAASEEPATIPPGLQLLQSEEVDRLDAPEARQGAAVDGENYYAIGNYQIARYKRATHQRQQVWRGDEGGPFIHLNSCFVDGEELACAHSNYPQLPFANSVEWFDRTTLRHTRSKSLGVMDEGSLV